MRTIPKDPDAVLDFAFDWNNTEVGEWLQAGEIITSYEVTVAEGITKDSDSESSGIVTVWLSGGTEGVAYRIECEIHTSRGRRDERSMLIYCEER